MTAVTAALRRALPDGLEAVYVTGSLSFGDYVPGASDVDMMVITRAPLNELQKRLIAGAVLPLAAVCPTRGLELVAYAASTLRRLERSWWRDEGVAPNVPFEVELNGGPAMRVSLAMAAEGRPPHWYVLDVSIAREHGLVVMGGGTRSLLPRVPPSVELAAILQALTWYGRRLPSHPSTVLTACRSWRRAENGDWSSKLEAATWAQKRLPGRAPLIAAALDRYLTGRPMPSQAEVADFIWEVRGLLVLKAA